MVVLLLLIPSNTQSSATAGVANPNANTAKHNIFFMSAPFVLANKIKLNCNKKKRLFSINKHSVMLPDNRFRRHRFHLYAAVIK
ncbi:Uncharacterised protein [Neisseria meningitidis]|nr:Uncharacterised protein [Neisseria meningitidis]